MKTRDYIPDKPCICINLRRISQKVTEIYDKALQPVGVSITQYSLLVNISRMEGCGTGELAQQVKLEKSTLVRTLQPLLRESLIVDKFPGGKRRRQLYLTQAGEDVLKKAFPLWLKVQDEISDRLGKSHDAFMEIFEEIDLWE